MSMSHDTRRNFLSKTAISSAALLGLSELPFLSKLRPVSAAEAKTSTVKLRPEIEPLVRVIEETPRSKLLEEIAGRLKKGLSYRELLAALQAAYGKYTEAERAFMEQLLKGAPDEK